MSTDYNNPRTDHDLSHFVFDCGTIGRVKTLSFTNVLPGDSVDIDAIGALRLSPLRRGLTLDSKVDICTFYVPYRHVYGQAWIDFIKKGQSADPIPDSTFTDPCGDGDFSCNYLGLNNAGSFKVPKWLSQSYLNIYNNYYKVPTDADETRKPNVFNPYEATFGLTACHLESIWTAPLPNGSITSRNMAAPGDNLDIIKLKQEFAKLETDQERDFFMTRYRDIIKSLGGHVDTDADNRPTMLMRTEFWASGYDVDGTSQSTMGQFSGRVQQSWRHSVPRFFVPEHGVIMTLILVRFSPIHSSERPYLATLTSPTYLDIAGDPALVANQPPVEVPIGSILSNSSKTNKFKMAHSQWYRYHPNFVNARYTLLQGFPFLNKPIECDINNVNKTVQAYVDPTDYEDMFETLQLVHWNTQCKFNVHVDRNLPTTRESIMTSN